ncbi:MAG: aldose epimerase family protein [Bacteroidota bacterium]
MDITKQIFGKLDDGREVELFTLSNNRGMEVEIISYGGIVKALRVPDKNHEPGDVVLGFDTLAPYLGDHPYFGTVVGRFANRIKGGRFTLDGKEYNLAINNGPNHLHGGIKGFDKVLWKGVMKKELDRVALSLAYMSPDMEEGYPGNLMVEVEYAVNDDNELVITYRAETDRPTFVNLTNHSYFNLSGKGGDIYRHELLIAADEYTLFDEHAVPTGEILPVEGTPFDFTTARAIGERIGDVAPGYDQNYVLSKKNLELEKIAALYDPESGRIMEVLTTEPGVQFYSSNYVNNVKGKSGLVYQKHSAVCLETQHFPDSPNQPGFPSTRLDPGMVFESTTIYRFTTE